MRQRIARICGPIPAAHAYDRTLSPGAPIAPASTRPLLAFAAVVDRINDRIGRGVSWLTLLVVLLLFCQVPLRLLPSGSYSTMSNDIGQLIHASVFMVGTAYAFRWDQHARVDIFYRQMARRRQAWVNLVGNLGFALPWLAVLGFYSTPIVVNSWQHLEVFVDSWAPGYFLLKSMLLVFAALMGLQALANAARALDALVEPDRSELEVPGA